MDNDDLLIFSQRVRQLRNELNLTQKEFAEGIDLTASALSAYENNTKNPSLIVARKISEKYHISIDWLCGLSDKKSTEDSTKYQKYSELIEALSKISDAMRLYIDNPKIAGEDNYVISIEDTAMQYFLEDWKGILELRNKGTIDNKLYSLWIEDKKKEYNFGWEHDEDGSPNPDLDIFLQEKRYGKRV